MAYEKNMEFSRTEEGENYQLYILELMAKNSIQSGKYDQAKEYLDIGEEICLQDEEKRKKGYATIQSLKAEYFKHNKEPEEAIICLEKAAAVFKEIHGDFSDQYANALYHISKLYDAKKDIELALQYLNEAIRNLEFKHSYI